MKARRGVSMEAIEREVVLPASLEEVWPAVSQSEQISAWFGAVAQLDLRPGGRGVFRWRDGTERSVLLEEVEPPRRLSFRWLPFQRTAATATGTVPSTRADITRGQEADAPPPPAREPSALPSRTPPPSAAAPPPE